MFVGSVAIAALVLIASWIYVDLKPSAGAERVFAVGASFAASAFWWMLLAQWAEREIRALAQVELERANDRARTALEMQTSTLAGRLDATRRSWETDVEALRTELHEAKRSREIADALLKTELARFAILTDGVPAAVYASRTNIDLRYNRDVSRHLAETSSYEFHGPTGVYVGARLLCTRADNRLRSVRVRLTDPTSDVALTHAAKARMQRPKHAHRTVATIKGHVRDDLYLSLVGLFDARHCSSHIEILFDSRGVGERVERFGPAIYVASVLAGEGKNFTHTLRWDRDRQEAQYLRHSANCDTVWKHVNGSSTVVFEPHSTDEDLVRVLSDLGFDPSELGTFRDRYEREYFKSHKDTLAHVAKFIDEIPLP